MFTRLIRGADSRRVLGTAACANGRRAHTLVAAVVAALAIGALAPGFAQARTPVLRVQGEALEWTAAGRHNTYKLLTIAPGAQSITTVVGRTYAPPPVPGGRVSYRVKAAYNESVWSNRVSISFPEGSEGEVPPEEEPPAEEGEAPEEVAGHVKYRVDAATYFDPFAQPQYAGWAKGHLSLIKGYPPFGDVYLTLFGVPEVAYHDPATEGQAPLEATGINAYVAKVRRDMGVGYAGVFVDDANWSAGYPPLPGPRANLANLFEAIRAAEPDAMIEVNSQYHDIWPLMKAGDANVARALAQIDVMCKEFGVGPSSGINTGQDYREFMQYVDTLHSQGIDLTLAGDANHNDVPTMEYNLATYFLLNDGGDYVSGSAQTPVHFWKGYDVELGKALGPRVRSASGVWSRRFEGGVVYAVEPQAPTQTINLATQMKSAEWGTVESITLAPGQGAVLVG